MFLNVRVQHEMHRVRGRRANQGQGEPAAAQLLHQPRSQIPCNRPEAGAYQTIGRFRLKQLLDVLQWLSITHSRSSEHSVHTSAWHRFSLQGNKDQILFLLVFLSAETAGRDHKDVDNPGKKCPLYQICKFVFFSLCRHSEHFILYLCIHLLNPSPRSPNSAVFLPT